LTPFAPVDKPHQDAAGNDGRAAAHDAAVRGNGILRIGRAIVRSRTTWFAVGALAGALGALALVWRAGTAADVPRQVLVVGGTQPGAFARIADAMASARSGDLVLLEPGVYRERVILGDGVELAARIPGTVTVGRPVDATGEIVGITASGTLSARISGIRIESTHELPMDIGVRLANQGHTLDSLEVTGPMRAAFELLPDSTATIQGSLVTVGGTAVTLADRSHVTLVNSIVLRMAAAGPRETAATRRAVVDAAIAMTASAQATLTRNVFAGYGTEIVKGVPPAVRQQIVAGNFVVGSQASFAR
jgi:hypothetical protein